MVVQKLSSDVTWTLLGLICSEDWAAVWLLSTKPSSPSVLLDLPSQTCIQTHGDYIAVCAGLYLPCGLSPLLQRTL